MMGDLQEEGVCLNDKPHGNGDESDFGQQLF